MQTYGTFEMERIMHNFKPHDYATMDDATFGIAVILEVTQLSSFAVITAFRFSPCIHDTVVVNDDVIVAT